MSNKPDTSIESPASPPDREELAKELMKAFGRGFDSSTKTNATRAGNLAEADYILSIWPKAAQSACPDPAAHRGCTNCCYLTSARKDHYDATVERNAAIARAEKAEAHAGLVCSQLAMVSSEHEFAFDVIFQLTSKVQGPGRAGIRSVIRQVVGEEMYWRLRAAERKSASARARSTQAAASAQTGTTASTRTATATAGTTATARSPRS